MSDWHFDPRRQIWRNGMTGSEYTAEEVQRLPPATFKAITGADPLVSTMATGRQTGKSKLGYPADLQDDDPLPTRIRADLIPSGATITFKTHKRYAYAAVFVLSLFTEGAPCWFITGEGKWFGTNALTNEQMSEVLSRPDTSHIRVVTDTTAGWRLLI